MLKTETINKISSLLKIKPEDLTTAITATEETDLALDEKLSVLSEAEKDILEKNKYAEGKKAGVEMNVDEVKKELGLEFQGKTIKGLVDAAKKKALEDAKIPEAEKVKELQKDLETVRAENTRLTTTVTNAETEAARAKTDRELFKEVPETSISASDLIDFARLKGYDFKLENGAIVPYKNGEPVKDNLAQPRHAKDVLNDFATASGFVKKEDVPPGGRGGGDKKFPATYTKLSDISKSFEAQGKSTLGSEFSEAVSKAASENKDFIMD